MKKDTDTETRQRVYILKLGISCVLWICPSDDSSPSHVGWKRVSLGSIPQARHVLLFHVQGIYRFD